MLLNDVLSAPYVDVARVGMREAASVARRFGIKRWACSDKEGVEWDETFRAD